MHLLNCPQCDASVSVSPAQAGGTVPCTGCGNVIAIPKLGDLRKLTRADETPSGAVTVDQGDASAGSRVGFVALSLVGLVCLLIASFCGVRYLLIDASMTTEKYIAEQREDYAKLTPAELIRIWESIEEYGIATTAPTEFRLAEIEKASLGTKAAVAGGLGLASILGAAGIAMAGGRRRTA